MNRSTGYTPRLSRVCGNASGKVTFGTIFSKFIPRKWEWVAKIEYKDNPLVVYSTRVGMNRIARLAAFWENSLSHVLGNEPDVNNYVEIQPVIIPRGREWIVPTGIILGKDKACPTHVGVNRQRSMRSLRALRLSHASWNESRKMEALNHQGWSIPHVWECVRRLSYKRHRSAVCPTLVWIDRFIFSGIYSYWKSSSISGNVPGLFSSYNLPVIVHLKFILFLLMQNTLISKKLSVNLITILWIVYVLK